MPTLYITENILFIALWNVLNTFGFTGVNGASVPIIKGQVNRVPEPRNDDFLVIWSVGRNRLSTNIDTYADRTLIGSINNNVLNVTSISQGLLNTGITINSVNLPIGVTILKQESGSPGSVGNYSLSNAPNLKSQLFYVGTSELVAPTRVHVQCDVHGPTSGDNAQILSTLFRDWYATDAFNRQGYDIAPLYADDPIQMPFTNAEAAFEDRWVVGLHMQVNPIVTVTQQFADKLKIDLIQVDTDATSSTGVVDIDSIPIKKGVNVIPVP